MLLGCCRVVVGLLSGCCRVVVGLLSVCCRPNRYIDPIGSNWLALRLPLLWHLYPSITIRNGSETIHQMAKQPINQFPPPPLPPFPYPLPPFFLVLSVRFGLVPPTLSSHISVCVCVCVCLSFIVDWNSSVKRKEARGKECGVRCYRPIGSKRPPGSSGMGPIGATVSIPNASNGFIRSLHPSRAQSNRTDCCCNSNGIIRQFIPSVSVLSKALWTHAAAWNALIGYDRFGGWFD